MSLKLKNERRNHKIYVDENNVYKIFNKGYSKHDVFAEAFITTLVENSGIAVPSIQEISIKDEQWFLKFPFIEGETLFSFMKKDPDNIDKYLDKFISIQTDIHRKKCPKLPIQKEKFADYINLSHLDKYLKIDLLDMLNSSPKHRKLCHGNLTPHNIILCDNKAYITDWNHACQGNASADVARTYLWMKINMPDKADTYLKKFCKATNTSVQYVKNWIPIVAAARLAKNIPEEASFLSKFISVIDY